MKKLTKGQRFALAREARRLAMECVEGTAPELGRGCLFMDGKPSCAFGHLVVRAGLPAHPWPYDPDDEAMRTVAFANDEFYYSASILERQAALVFPLLALADSLADSLEASKASARKRPQKQSPEVP